MPKFPYDAILLDADETIFNFHESEKISVLKAAKSFNIDADTNDAKVYSSINLSLWKLLETGDITREELKVLRFVRWFDYLGVHNVNPADFTFVYENYLSDTSILFEGAEDFVKSLSELCSVYIVTNGSSKCQNGRMANSPIKEYISGMFVSEEVGYTKPDKRFFDIVLDTIHVIDRTKVIIIGDSLTSDMQGGRNAGIHTCRYFPACKEFSNPLCDYIITDYNKFFDIIK